MTLNAYKIDELLAILGVKPKQCTRDAVALWWSENITAQPRIDPYTPPPAMDATERTRDLAEYIMGFVNKHGIGYLSELNDYVADAMRIIENKWEKE